MYNQHRNGFLQNKILITLFTILISSFSLSQNQAPLRMKDFYGLKNNDLRKSRDFNDPLNSKLKAMKTSYHIGFQAGFHSPNLTKNSLGSFNRGILGELYISFNLSDEVHSIIAFTYWQSEIKGINTPIVQIPSETINSKGLKLEVDFSLFNIYTASLLLGPSIAIENITSATNTVFSLGANLKLNLPLPHWDEKVNLMATFNYQNGSEFLNFGGGINYSFFSYLIGIEIGI